MQTSAHRFAVLTERWSSIMGAFNKCLSSNYLFTQLNDAHCSDFTPNRIVDLVMAYLNCYSHKKCSHFFKKSNKNKVENLLSKSNSTKKKIVRIKFTEPYFAALELLKLSLLSNLTFNQSSLFTLVHNFSWKHEENENKEEI